MSVPYFLIQLQHKLPENKLEKGLFLFMYRATRIPPHLGIIFNGQLFDITLQGPNVGVDASVFLSTIIKKYTKTIFFELKLPNSVDDEAIINLLTNVMEKFNNVSETTSCISPIKLFFNEAYQLNTSQINFIFDLIPLLHQNQLIKNTYHLNLERNISNNEFLLKTYTKEDIINCIHALNLIQISN